MVHIFKNPNGDTRTAKQDVTLEEFKKANEQHIDDVSGVMYELSRLVDEAGENHDCTKLSQAKLFYDNFVSTMKHNADFVNDEWYQMHITAERHHLLSKCPHDVNLIDVLEMISDCVCAGLSRSGEVRELELSHEILDRAVKNTVQLISDMIQVHDEEVPESTLPVINVMPL